MCITAGRREEEEGAEEGEDEPKLCGQTDSGGDSRRAARGHHGLWTDRKSVV